MPVPTGPDHRCLDGHRPCHGAALAGSGWTVLAGVREAADGDALTVAGRQRVIRRSTLDVTDAAQIEQAAQRVARDSRRRRVWTRSSTTPAVGVGGPLELLPWRSAPQFDVNVFGQVAVTGRCCRRCAAPWADRVRLLRRRPGRDAIHGSLCRLQVRARGDRRTALRVELLGSRYPGGADRAGLGGDADLGQESRPGRRASQIPTELRRAYGQVPAAMAKALQSTARRGIPPEQVARTIERALSARRMRARYSSAATRRRCCGQAAAPGPLFDRCCAGVGSERALRPAV